MKYLALTFAGKRREFTQFLDILRMRAELNEGITVAEFLDSANPGWRNS